MARFFLNGLVDVFERWPWNPLERSCAVGFRVGTRPPFGNLAAVATRNLNPRAPRTLEGVWGGFRGSKYTF